MKRTQADVRLRLMDDSDGPLYVALYSHAETMRHIAKALGPDQAGRSFAAAVIANQRHPPETRFWVIEAQGTRESLGLIGLHFDTFGGAELGVVLPPALQGRGIATASIKSLFPVAFGVLGLSRLHTWHTQSHALAGGLMAAVGFVPASADPARPGKCWELAADRWRARQEQEA